MDNNTQFSELFRDEYTENIFGEACFGEPVDYESAEDIVNGIKMSVSLEERPIFLEGLAERLTALGVPCSVSDTDTMLTEIRSRFKTKLGKTCPRTILEWIRGTIPGTVNRLNNYDLCYALDMDYKETSVFFQKNFLTLPFVLRNRLDAVFFYCLYHKKPYTNASEMLKESESFPVQETVHTETMQIRAKIREIDDVPVIMLTAKGEDMDKILGLEYGADDYITKPFNVLEVKARLKAIMRRSKPKKENGAEGGKVIKIGDLVLESDAKRVISSGREINLTAKEYDLLDLLANNPDKVYSREDLLRIVWGYDFPGDVRTVDVHIRRLREKIEDNPGEPRYVQTKWGRGYYLKP